jgi:hypothetical protein
MVHTFRGNIDLKRRMAKGEEAQLRWGDRIYINQPHSNDLPTPESCSYAFGVFRLPGHAAAAGDTGPRAAITAAAAATAAAEAQVAQPSDSPHLRAPGSPLQCAAARR